MTAAERLARVRDLFDRMIALPRSQRRDELQRACPDDPELFEEVLELLGIDEREEGAPSKSISQLESGQGASWLAEHLATSQVNECLPQTIGPYQIIRVVGLGSMGMVYEAHQPEPARSVAIKVLHAGLLSPGTLRRFQREARALASLQHPGIVALYEVGSAPIAAGLPPQPYLAMELVEGDTLRTALASRSLHVEQKLELIAMLCEAVHAAHQKGIVHRDLKPDNIVLTTLNDGAILAKHHPGVQPKILDFGVSDLVESEGTISGEVVGTPPYLSPEQARGELTDTRTDIYALGVIAFELLSGTWPFDIKGVSGTEAIRRVLAAEPRRLQSHSPGLHHDIYTIVAKAMHPDPAMRYSSAAELGRDVRRFLSHQPILARRPSAGYIVARFVRRNRALTSLAAAAIAMLVTALIVITNLWMDAKQTRAQALWQSYRASMSAASVDLADGDVASARAALEATPTRHRGWEHRHLVSRLDESVRVLTTPAGHTWSILPESNGTAVLISVNDITRIDLTTAGPSATQPDERLRLYYGAKAATFPQFMEWPRGKVWSPGASTGVREHDVPLWPDWPNLTIVTGTVSRDDRVMAIVLTGITRNEVIVLDLASSDSRIMGLAPEERVLRVGLSPDGSRLVMAATSTPTAPNSLRLVDARSMRELARSLPLDRPAQALAMEPDGHHFVIMLQSGELQRWSVDADQLTLLRQAVFDQDAAEGLTFSTDGTMFACGSRDGLVRVFDTESLALISEQRGHEREIVSVSCLPQSPSHPAARAALISTALDGRVRLWDWLPRKPAVVSLQGHEHLVHGLAYGQQGRRVWTGSWDKTIALYDADTGTRLATAPTQSLVQAVVVSHDERVLASREFGGLVRIWDAANLNPLESVPVPAEMLNVPAFDENDEHVIIEPPMEEAGFRAWNRRTQKVEVLPRAAIGKFSATWISPRAGLYAVTQARGTQRTSVLFDIKSGRERFALVTARAADESITFTPDGEAFATPGPDHAITLYSTQSLTPIGEFRGHTREVLAMVISPDGRRLFSADFTGVIRVWDVKTRQEVAQLRGHAAHLRRLIMTPDGQGLISGARDGEARVWWAATP